VIKGEFRYACPVEGGPEILTGIAEDEIAALCALVKPGMLVLEVGSAYGFSAISMALAGARVLTVDDRSGVEVEGLPSLEDNVRACGVADRVFTVTGDSVQVLPFLGETEALFELVFVDGGSEQTGPDIEYGWLLLDEGGWLARHDYREKGSPKTTEALDMRFPDGPDELTRTLWVKRK